MESRRRILVLIPHLGGGGAERVAEQVARGLNPVRYEVHLGVVLERGRGAGSEMGERVRVHELGARRVRYAGLSILWLVWSLRPDVVLSGMAHLNKLVLWLRSLFPRKTRVLVRQNGSPAADSGPGSWKLYPRADAIICQTFGMAAEMAAVCSAGCLRVLPNPVDVDGIRALAGQPNVHWRGAGPNVLGVGRLAAEKGFDLLLQAFALLRQKYPAADLVILGEGRERPALEMLAWVLGLGGSVRMPGEVAHPAEWYAGTTVYVSASRREGLPNALLEAAAGGLPIAATRASTGLVEVLEGRSGVWLARETSPAAICEAMDRAIVGASRECRVAHEWVEGFRAERAIGEYEALIEEQLAGAAR